MIEPVLTNLLRNFQSEFSTAAFLLFLVVFLVTAPGAVPLPSGRRMEYFLSNFFVSRMALFAAITFFSYAYLFETTEVGVSNVNVTENVASSEAFADFEDFSVEVARETEAVIFYQASFVFSEDLPEDLVLVPIIEDSFSNSWIQASGWIVSAAAGQVVESSFIPVSRQSSYPLVLRYYSVPRSDAESSLNVNFGRLPSVELNRDAAISDGCILQTEEIEIVCGP